jgi:hypothetical protein
VVDGAARDQPNKLIGSHGTILARFVLQKPSKLHPLDRLNAQQIKPALNRSSGEVAEKEPARAQLIILRFDHRAVFEKLAVPAG